MSVTVIVLAAGFGTRMRSRLPKVLHPLAGRPLVEWVVRAATPVCEQPPVVVVGHERAAVQASLGGEARYVVQDQQLGTGHAVQQAESLLRDQVEKVIVLYGDMPLLKTQTLLELVTVFDNSSDLTAIAMLTVERDDPQGFGRVVRDNSDRVQRVVEEVDCTPEQKAIRELNVGIYCFDAEWLWNHLAEIPLSSKGEYFLTDMVGIAVETGRQVVTLSANMEEVYGINDRSQLAVAADVLRQRTNTRHMLEGVTIVDPANTYIDDTVQIGRDTTVLPGSFLNGTTVIGEECIIGPYSELTDCEIGNHCRVKMSVLEQARMDPYSEIGPFGRLRPNAHLGENVHMGNFGEVKNSYVGAGTSIGHFSYIGDAQIGENVNIGAGTITCNYDGQNKNKTVIGDNAFIGSDSLLVAPVEVGERARTGAGSVVTRNIPDDALAYGVPARTKADS